VREFKRMKKGFDGGLCKVVYPHRLEGMSGMFLKNETKRGCPARQFRIALSGDLKGGRKGVGSSGARLSKS